MNEVKRTKLKEHIERLVDVAKDIQEIAVEEKQDYEDMPVNLSTSRASSNLWENYMQLDSCSANLQHEVSRLQQIIGEKEKGYEL